LAGKNARASRSDRGGTEVHLNFCGKDTIALPAKRRVAIRSPAIAPGLRRSKHPGSFCVLSDHVFAFFMPNPSPMSTVTQINAKIGKYRWTICALLFFATTVNYLDRQVLSLLKGDLEREFNWSDSDYANILTVFQFVYAISMLFAGRIIDWLGTKAGYAWSLIIWSVAQWPMPWPREPAGS